MSFLSKYYRPFYPRVRKTVAFTGAAGVGAQGTVAVFAVTGRVLLHRMIAFCTEDLAGATATIELGATGFTAGIIAQTTATDIDNGEFWQDATPQANGRNFAAASEASSAPRDTLLSSGIILTVGTADITDGTIIFDAWWEPITDGARLAAA